jgi:3-isopropylmalate/(R)-2-methylmalate dehydratase large subunit
VSGKTISEKILSAKSRRDARAGDIVVCDVDLVLGTDASSPMAIDYFDRMAGTALFDPVRVMFAMDHYAPPATPVVAAFHDRIRRFARTHGAEVREVGDGISFQLAAELGRAVPGSLVIGADSHTVTLGALGLFATGVGSSDLAAAMITGQVWLRVPETIHVRLDGECPPSVTAKDVALELVRLIGPEGANYQTLEIDGPAMVAFSLEDRLVISNLGVEMGAKAAIFGVDAETEGVPRGPLAPSDHARSVVVASDGDARYAREVVVDVSNISPRISLPTLPTTSCRSRRRWVRRCRWSSSGRALAAAQATSTTCSACWSAPVDASRPVCSWCSRPRPARSSAGCGTTVRSTRSPRWAGSSRHPAVAPAAERAA